MSRDVSISAAGAERLDELEPLWRALHAAHHALAAHVAPTRPVDVSWRRRRARYERWLAGPDTTLLIAARAGAAVGYAVLRLQDGPATWDVGERVGELETLVVAESERDGGVGAALVAASRERARAAGVRRLSVGVAHANEAALRFYRREGFRPFYTLLLDAG